MEAWTRYQHHPLDSETDLKDIITLIGRQKTQEMGSSCQLPLLLLSQAACAFLLFNITPHAPVLKLDPLLKHANQRTLIGRATHFKDCLQKLKI